MAVVVASSAAHPIGATGRLSVSDEFESHETSGMFDVRTGCDAPPARWRSRWPRRSETRRSVRPADADALPASVARYCGVEERDRQPARVVPRAGVALGEGDGVGVRGARVEDEELVEHRRVDGAASVGKLGTVGRQVEPQRQRRRRVLGVARLRPAERERHDRRLVDEAAADDHLGVEAGGGGERRGGGGRCGGGGRWRRRRAAAGGAAAGGVRTEEMSMSLSLR